VRNQGNFLYIEIILRGVYHFGPELLSQVSLKSSYIKLKKVKPWEEVSVLLRLILFALKTLIL